MGPLLDSSGANWILESVTDINDLGQIVGTGMYDPDGPGGVAAVQRAFLLTPVPEPIGVHLIAFALLARRRRL